MRRLRDGGSASQVQEEQEILLDHVLEEVCRQKDNRMSVAEVVSRFAAKNTKRTTRE